MSDFECYTSFSDHFTLNFNKICKETRAQSVLLTPNLNVKRQLNPRLSCDSILEYVFGQTDDHKFPISLSMLYFI